MDTKDGAPKPDGQTTNSIAVEDSAVEESEKTEDSLSPRDDEEYPDECTLFVGDIARNLNEEELKTVFSKYGEIVAAEIKRDRVTNYSLGYAFVQFKTRRQASDAKKALHKSSIGNRQIRIGWAQKNTNIFVGDLDPSVTTEQLREVFRKFGPIYDEDTFVKHRNYGFVRFRHRAHAEKAKKEMDGKMLGNRPIRIGWGDANTQKYCVHIQFNPEDAQGWTELDITNAFKDYGEIVSVNLPRSFGSLKGFGFVHYEDTDEGEAAASNAIRDLNGSAICGVRIQCNFGKKQQWRGGKGFGKKSRPGMYPVQMVMPLGPQAGWQTYMLPPQGQQHPPHAHVHSQPPQPPQPYYLPPAQPGRDSFPMYSQPSPPMYPPYYNYNQAPFHPHPQYPAAAYIPKPQALKEIGPLLEMQHHE
mmetsp:Transcript_9280/g.23245  ORF Transcript_9280/g.23245 Transcript_9280/m.23245 type:complete len:415 (+) Transcript_9280:211-1455(+)|eukprot:CAMPEP_0177646482 /NCGR_PEP_ID=MMETSP0447-20121125/9796_1 /TAXON_ID=0 /ORGANISM="Stygamoeba regulata, Strain BSH-02190019" /LENGTH=414 /DNA_ID=CAMNT_0019149015 /DNA_START=173 /DNA_END=1417 /DNA_ORIENTATION=+